MMGGNKLGRRKSKREISAVRGCPGVTRTSRGPVWLGEVVDEVRQVAGARLF